MSCQIICHTTNFIIYSSQFTALQYLFTILALEMFGNETLPLNKRHYNNCRPKMLIKAQGIWVFFHSHPVGCFLGALNSGGIHKVRTKHKGRGCLRCLPWKIAFLGTMEPFCLKGEGRRWQKCWHTACILDACPLEWRLQTIATCYTPTDSDLELVIVSTFWIE